MLLGAATSYRVKTIYVVVCTSILIAASLLAFAVVGPRQLHIGSDTSTYASYFNGVIDGVFERSFEPGFFALTVLLSWIFADYKLYFSIIYLLVTFAMLGAASCAISGNDPINRSISIVAAFSFLLISTWHTTAVINAIRQGVALSFIYLFVMKYIRYDNKWNLFPAGVLGMLFHLPSVAALIAAAAKWLKPRTVLIIFYLLAAAYAGGITEYISVIVSSLSGYDIHGRIINYSQGSGEQYFGFRLDFFIYTIFWPPFYWIADRFVVREKRELSRRILSVYMMLCIPYFLFGFGGFSNRWAFMAWYFLPILHSCYFSAANLSNSLKSAILFMVLILATFRHIVWYEWL